MPVIRSPTTTGVFVGAVTYPKASVRTIQTCAGRHVRRFLFFLHPTQVLKRYLPVFGFRSTHPVVSRSNPVISPTGEPQVVFVIGYNGVPYDVALGQPATHGSSGIWLIVRIARHRLFLGTVPHTPAAVRTIQAQVNAGNASYSFYLHPYQVLQRTLPSYGFVGAWTLVTPPTATPVPTMFIGPNGHPTIRYTIRYAGSLYIVTVQQLLRTGPRGIWLITSIIKHP